MSCHRAAGYREGFLWKRGRDNGQYLSRKFILSEQEGALKYFVKPDVSAAKTPFSVFERQTYFRMRLSRRTFAWGKRFSLQGREPKAIMSIGTVNATFQPTKIGTAHGLQITYLKDNSTRNIFVYHEDGKVRDRAQFTFEPL